MNTSKSHNKFIIYAMVLAIGTCWGFSFLATSLLVKVIDPVQVLTVRWTIAGLIFLAMIAMGKIKLDLSKKGRGFLVLCAFCQPVAYMFCENNGIKYTSASVGSIMIATIPCMVLIFNALIYKQRTSRMGVVSILLAFAGVAMCTMLSPAFSIHGELKGYFLMIGAVVAGAFYTVFSARASSSYNSVEITAFQAIFGLIIFNIMNLAMGFGFETYSIVFSDWKLIAGVAFLGVFCSAFCFFAFNKTISMMDPALANNMNASTTTIVGALAGIIIGGDPGGWYTAVGLVMTLAGVILSSKQID